MVLNIRHQFYNHR